MALALLDTPDALIVCNGYKDRAYVELALLAQKLGRTPIVVIDRFQFRVISVDNRQIHLLRMSPLDAAQE